MNRDIIKQLQQTPNEIQRTWIITENLLNFYPPDVKEAAIAVAVPHWFNQTILATLLDIESSDAVRLYGEIQAISFSEPFGTLGYKLQDLTRTAIFAYLCKDHPLLFKTYCKRMYEYFRHLHDPQHQIEASFHWRAIKGSEGIERFRKQMRTYRKDRNFSATDNLLRNAFELERLGLLSDEEVDEIKKQENYTAQVFGIIEGNTARTLDEIKRARVEYKPTRSRYRGASGNYSLLPTGNTTFTKWLIEGQSENLKCWHRYLCIIQGTNKLGWIRVTENYITYIHNKREEQHQVSIYPCILHFEAIWDEEELCKKNLQITIKPKGSSGYLEIGAKFSLKTFRLLKGQKRRGPRISHIEKWIRNNSDQFKEDVLKLLLLPFRMKRIYKITEQCLEDLRNEGLPDEILGGLKPLEDQEIITKNKFLGAVKKQIGEGGIVRYDELILKYAQYSGALESVQADSFFGPEGAKYKIRVRRIQDSGLILCFQKC